VINCRTFHQSCSSQKCCKIGNMQQMPTSDLKYMFVCLCRLINSACSKCPPSACAHALSRACHWMHQWRVQRCESCLNKVS